MSKRLHPCRTCKPSDGGKFTRRGFTRHDDRICSRCRRWGSPSQTVNYKGRAA